MRASPHVHVDETGWRIDGRNFWLWAFTDPTFVLYHVDESRGGKVPLKLLGKAFGGVVVADFYAAYNALAARKQRCLVHLLREVKEASEADAQLSGVFVRETVASLVPGCAGVEEGSQQAPQGGLPAKNGQLGTPAGGVGADRRTVTPTLAGWRSV